MVAEESKTSIDQLSRDPIATAAVGQKSCETFNTIIELSYSEHRLLLPRCFSSGSMG